MKDSKQMQQTAVIYIRVSDESQIKNNSLGQQEECCRKYAKAKGLKVLKLFKEEGESAKHIHTRPELQSLLKFCVAEKPTYVIVYKIDRWTRNTEEGLAAEAYLARKGTELQSASEYIDRSPTGKFMKTILMAAAEMDNNIKSERVRDTMRTMFQKGMWCWKPPAGYKRPFKTKEENKGLVMIIDPEVGPLISLMFEKAAEGMYSIQWLTNYVNELGFENAYGKPMINSLVRTVIKNPIYYGTMYAKEWDLSIIGRHKPLVTQEIWEKANYYLFGRKRLHNFQDKVEFPLKGIIKCMYCDRYMCSSNPKGRSKHYLHYQCPKCRKSVNVDIAHKQFAELMNSIVASDEVLKVTKELIRRDWEKHRTDLNRQIQAIDEQIKLKTDELKTIIKARDRCEFPEDLAKIEIDRLNGELIALRVSLSDVKIEDYSDQIVENFFEHFVKHLYELWLRVDLAKKQTLQSAIFPEGIHHDFKTIRTMKLCPLFKQIELARAANIENVTPGEFESPLTE